MHVKVVTGDITEIEADASIVNLFEGVGQPGGATGAVDRALDGAISRLIESGEIKGKLGDVALIHTLGRMRTARVVVAGLGKQPEFALDKVRQVVAEACRFLRKKGARRVATITHGAGVGGIEPEQSARAIAEGAILGLYTFRKHITKDPETSDLEELLVVERDESRVGQLERGCRYGTIVSEAANMARDMINEPANYMTPSNMAEAARQMSADYGLECTVLEREQMRELGMGALLGVAQGSHQEPRFIVLHYRGDPGSQKAIGLVGKGITFDSGGISIKPSEGMAEMKGDMAGGATVMAALSGIARLKPRVNVTALVPATENLPGGAALKPGDVVKAMNGKSVEVVNTDAEGRLILADALCYARRLGLSPLVDVATLTNACRIALGKVCTGAFTNNQELVEKVIKAGQEAGERVWQMPMYEEYKEQNKSDVADIKNTGGRFGGAITAAQFLGEFVEDTPWVHLDIAGTAESDKEKGYLVKGATGVGVRTLVGLTLALAEEQA
ncbi:MAG: leucyl aminopeptidase [Chloroflexi bacterium]|nr:MAG: leucyl aminopeptidase [Chloroflexota bacterium]